MGRHVEHVSLLAALEESGGFLSECAKRFETHLDVV